MAFEVKLTGNRLAALGCSQRPYPQGTLTPVVVYYIPGCTPTRLGFHRCIFSWLHASHLCPTKALPWGVALRCTGMCTPIGEMQLVAEHRPGPHLPAQPGPPWVVTSLQSVVPECPPRLGHWEPGASSPLCCAPVPIAPPPYSHLGPLSSSRSTVHLCLL